MATEAGAKPITQTLTVKCRQCGCRFTAAAALPRHYCSVECAELYAMEQFLNPRAYLGRPREADKESGR